MAAISSHACGTIWDHEAAITPSPAGIQAHGVSTLTVSLQSLCDVTLALQTLPERLLAIGSRSSQRLFLRAILPPVIEVAHRIAIDASGFSWDAIDRIGAALAPMGDLHGFVCCQPGLELTGRQQTMPLPQLRLLIAQVGVVSK